MSTVVVVGNPKPGSRTAHAATLLATALTGHQPDQIIDVVELGAGLLGWEDPGVTRAVQATSNAELVIVASPTFKATYSGLLKLFLDQFATGDGLRGVVAVPLMLGAGPAHGMAPDLLLKPLLVELRATCPAPGLYLSDKTYEDGIQIGKYAEAWGHVLSNAVLGWRAR
ncbi:NADPH-dependent FMN reductase [Aminobacter sp. HY435]|uniref:NADPH-dependent FMN reductase n=1 Tax=Aminobacter sp. HY435 TaxID=2970917 RepID=UPI0022B9B93E|nr:NAD(P)H-dependent oxidoreductase [Aminobacter sp. HY435]